MNKSAKTLFALLATLVVSPSAFAANYDVGPGAAYATLQSAIDAAIAAGGANVVRVQAGTYNENIVSTNQLVPGKTLEVSGGWNATYTAQNADPTMTIIDGGGNQVININSLDGGTLNMNYLTVTNGGNTAFGGGMYMLTSGSTNVTLNHMIFSNNHALSGAGSASGGGLMFHTLNTSSLQIQNSIFDANSATSTVGSASGGGLYVSCDDSANIVLYNNQVINNTATSNVDQVNGAGLNLLHFGACTGDIFNNLVSGNNIAAPSAAAVGPGAVIWQWSNSTGSLNVFQNRFLNNVDDNGFATAQVEVATNNTGTILFSDSLIAGSNRGGLRVGAFGTSALHVNNVTVADNTGYEGIAFMGPGTFTFYNSIIQGNQTDAPSMTGGAAPTTGNNMIGIDPLFRGRAAGDYRLTSASAAIDAGNPAECAFVDVFGEARVVDGDGDMAAICDIGADEFDPDPMNSAPAATVLLTPADASTGIDGTSVAFTWEPVVDPDGDTVTYHHYLCTSADFSGCSESVSGPVVVALGAGGAGLLLIGFTGHGRRRLRYTMAVVLMSVALISACGNSSGGAPTPTGTTGQSITMTGLAAGTTYYWHVVAYDGNGNSSVSDTWSFTTL